MRIAILQGNFGNFDIDYQPFNVEQELPEGWTLDRHYFDDISYPYRSLAMSNRLKGKIPKALGYEEIPEYDYYIWMDSNITVNSPNAIQAMVNTCNDNDILLFNHNNRRTLGEEFGFMLHGMNITKDPYLTKRYDGELIQEQYYLYQDALDEPLYALYSFVYNKSFIKTGVMKEWFYHCCRYSVQDQLSLPYLLKHSNAKVKSVDWDLCDTTNLMYHWSHS